MDPPGPDANGLAETVQRWVARLGRCASTRLDLAALELTEAREAAVGALVRLAVAALLAVTAWITLTLALVLALPPDWRAGGAGVLALLYAGTAWLIYRNVRARFRDRPPPFSATRDELKRDREWINALK